MHSEICISANVNYDWALNLSTRYFLLIVLHPISWLLHRLESFEESPMSCHGLHAPDVRVVSGSRLQCFACLPLIGHALP